MLALVLSVALWAAIWTTIGWRSMGGNLDDHWLVGVSLAGVT